MQPRGATMLLFLALALADVNPAVAAELPPWAIGDDARLITLFEADSVTLWDGPGGPHRDRARVGRLPGGTPVVVLETHTLPAGTWLRVRQLDLAEPVGWVPAYSLSRQATMIEPPSPAVAARLLAPPPTWGVMLGIGGGRLGPTELREEYDAGIRLEAQCLRFLPGNWQTGAGVGWRKFAGQPVVYYIEAGSPFVDLPSDSRLSILDLGLRAGMRHGDETDLQISWLLGPTLFRVHESARGLVVRDSNGAPVGVRNEELGRWTGGADLRLQFSGRQANGTEIGLLVGGYVMSWTALQQKSLTTGFIADKLYGFDVAISFTIPGARAGR